MYIYRHQLFLFRGGGHLNQYSQFRIIGILIINFSLLEFSCSCRMEVGSSSHNMNRPIEVMLILQPPATATKHILILSSELPHHFSIVTCWSKFSPSSWPSTLHYHHYLSTSCDRFHIYSINVIHNMIQQNIPMIIAPTRLLLLY